jgi:hypothetical protein
MGKPHRYNPPRTIPRRPDNHYDPITKQAGRDETPLAIVPPCVFDFRDRAGEHGACLREINPTIGQDFRSLRRVVADVHA